MAYVNPILILGLHKFEIRFKISSRLSGRVFVSSNKTEIV